MQKLLSRRIIIHTFSVGTSAEFGRRPYNFLKARKLDFKSSSFILSKVDLQAFKTFRKSVWQPNAGNNFFKSLWLFDTSNVMN